MTAKNMGFLTPDEAREFQIPQEVNKFLNQEIRHIYERKMYPRASLFEDIQKGRIAQVDAPTEEKKAAVLCQLEIGHAVAVWACPDCKRIIGLIRTPLNRIPDVPRTMLAGFFFLYAQSERLECPNCTSRNYVILKPTFLISGQPLPNLSEV